MKFIVNRRNNSKYYWIAFELVGFTSPSFWGDDPFRVCGVEVTIPDFIECIYEYFL